MSYYAVRDTAKAESRPWNGAWVATVSSTEANGVVVSFAGLSTGSLRSAEHFRSLKMAQSFVILVTIKKPEYIGRLAVHAIEWGTSGRQLLIGRQE